MTMHIYILKVEDTERVVVSTPEFLAKASALLSKTPKRTLGNYLMWRAVMGSLAYLDKQAREALDEFSRRRSGRRVNTPRWKECVAVAGGSFNAAVGKR